MANPNPRRTGKNAAHPTIDELAAQRESDRRVLDLALRGRNGVQIAAELGIDKSTVTRTLQRVWERTEQPRATELRAKWDYRIEVGIDAIWDKFIEGDLAAVNAFVRLAERAAKLHGLDQQMTRDAGALADALLGDPDARRDRLAALRDELAAKRAEKEAEQAG